MVRCILTTFYVALFPQASEHHRGKQQVEVWRR